MFLGDNGEEQKLNSDTKMPRPEEDWVPARIKVQGALQ